MTDGHPGGETIGDRRRRFAAWAMAMFYILAGVVHLRSPGFFLPAVPDWVPRPYETVLLTGLCEIAGAIGLLIPRTQRLAGIMLALYAACVFPANIKHALDDLGAGTGLGWWYHAPRLMLQPVIVWWALYAGGLGSASRSSASK